LKAASTQRQLPDYAETTFKVHRLSANSLFNGMIAPMTPMAFRGVPWYQGESNVGDSAAYYATLLKTLIADWRTRSFTSSAPSNRPNHPSAKGRQQGSHERPHPLMIFQSCQILYSRKLRHTCQFITSFYERWQAQLRTPLRLESNSTRPYPLSDAQPGVRKLPAPRILPT
jgi:hypothetical protein